MFKLYLFHRALEYEGDDKNHPCPKGFGWRAYNHALQYRQAGGYYVNIRIDRPMNFRRALPFQLVRTLGILA